MSDEARAVVNPLGGVSRRLALRRLAGGAAGTAVALLASACGAGSTGAGSAGGPAASRAPAEITYMTTWNMERLEVLNQGLDLFRQKFPHIKVNVAPSIGRDQITAAFAAGSAPDSLWIEGQVGPRLYEGGQLLDLTAHVRAAKLNLDKDYISSKLERWGSKVFAMPHTVSPHAWYYNKSMLKQAGARDPWDDLKGNWAWPDLLDAAKKVTKVGGANDDVWGVQLDYTSAWYQNSGFVWTNDGLYIDTSAGPTEWRKWKYTFSHPRTLEGLQFVYDLLTTHRVMISKERASELTASGINNLFSAQRVAMFENSSGQLITQLRANNIFEWDVVPIPRVRAGGRAGVPLWSGNPTGVNKDGKFVDAAWELALQMALDDIQNVFSKARVVTAALVRSLTIPGGFESPPPAHVSAFRAAGIENSGSWNYHPAFAEIETIVVVELGMAFKQEKSLRQACADIDAQANAIMARGT
ncbi:MAG TPA: sugar ABC transporter substrate-binding protein [Chloroflexota bacterium]|nr:sugar ABC transporter substrate-binding protein [Chloroflexota bacterium]